jgi:aspartyl-tRNA(Asn)/glutamyl-tRNA(Gln) amidotransferase subunit A
LEAEPRENFEKAVDVLKEQGAKIVDVHLDTLEHSIAVYYILATAEASTNLARFDGIRYGERSCSATTLDEVYDLSRMEGFGREVKRRILLGTFVLSAGYKDAYYKKAQQVRTLMMDSFDTAFDTCDAILLPTAPNVSFPSGSVIDPIQLYLQDIFTISANLAGLPAISVPSGFNKQGMPFGLQIIGPQLCDVAVVQYAHAFERATNHLKMPPNIEISP